MIVLYLAPTSNGLRAAVALEECGLPYRPQRVDLAKGEQHTPEFMQLNSAAAIPVLVDSDGPGGEAITLSQSGAIILYAAEKSGKFLPRDLRARAAALQWFMHVTTDVSGASSALFLYGNAAPDKTEGTSTFFEQRLLKHFANCDSRLGQTEYLAGEISVADLALYPNYVSRMPLLDKAGGLEHLRRWGTAMASRPGVARGMAVFS